MPVLCIFYGIIIKMYWNEHPPPHFHAYYADRKASISIDQLGIIKGNLPARAERFVLEWAAEHQEELRENWRRCELKQSLSKIDPLK